MASSPPPPFSASLPNPKKRPSMSSQASLQSASKKPRLHPLRNASFPTQDPYAITSAQSETGSVANSMVSGTSSKAPKGRKGRPRKSAQLNDNDLLSVQNANADDQSQTGRRMGGARSVVSARSGAANDDEDEDEPEADIGDDEKERLIAAAELDSARQINFQRQLDPDANQRMTKWKAIALDKAVIRRMANATVSQSIGKNPLMALGFYAKYFLGEIIERAREVQSEYAKAYDKTREMEKKWREDELERLLKKQGNGGLGQQEAVLVQRDITRLRKEVKDYIPNPHKGGLLPDHLREAQRRYRADGEGGGVGYGGLSQSLLGITGSASWRVGDGAAPRRLFR